MFSKMPAQTQPTLVVITDTNVLINFFHIGQLSLLGNLSKYQFFVPSEVIAEVTEPVQAAALAAALNANYIEKIDIVDPVALGIFADLRSLMGRGEAACLAAAATLNHSVASDEKKIFKRKAIELIGEDRLLRTEDLLLCAIREELITVAQADNFKATLATNRYAMAFASFADIV